VDRALQPGMRLMRTMGITAKFGVVTLLLLVPLTIGVGSGYAESTGRLRAAQQQRAGLKLAGPLVQLVIQLAQTEDAAARGIAPPLRLTAVDEVDAAERATGSGPPRPADLAEAWRQARADVEALSDQTDPGRAVDLAARALQRCVGVLKEVTDDTGLAADPQLDTYYLLSGLVTTLPRLAVAAGSAARAEQGADGPAQRRLERALGVRTVRKLADQLADDLATANRYTTWQPLGQRVAAGANAVEAAVAQYASAGSGAGTGPDVTPLGSGSLASATGALATQLSTVVDTLLTRRQDELSSSRDRPVLLALSSLLVLGYLLVAVYRATSQDVHAVLQDISTVANGQQPREDLPSGSDEFARMSRAVTITRDRLTALLGSLRYQATHDELTALGNRTLFTDKIAEALAVTGRGVAVVVADLEHFRDVNDSFGHDLGDRLLRAVGVRFHRACGRQNVVARLGSDEFGVLLPLGGGEAAALDVVSRLRAALQAPVDVEGRLLQVSATFGVAVSGPDRRSAAELIRDADVALVAARDTTPATRDDGTAAARVAVFQPAMHERTRARTELSAELVGAVERGELELVYQPIVDLQTDVVHGVEALVRWNHPTRGLVPPTAFVPLAEATGSIVPVGRWVLREAALQLARWRAEFPDGYPLIMEVNLSTGQLSDPGLVPTVIALVEETGVDPRDLTLEITESSLVEDIDVALRPLRQLAAVGVRLALDDFGTGYSSLTYLRRLPVSVLKIDRSFVVDTDGPGDTSGVLLGGIARLGTGLGMQIVAEGVETPRQAARVRAAGCQLGQGFLWARPMTAEDVTVLLRRGGDLTPDPRSAVPLPRFR
jgi:diguanylate cyclase (GGDEF)-like protein